MTRRFRDWLKPRGEDHDELDALLTEAWEDGAAALAKVLDLDAGKASLLAARDRQEPAVRSTAEGSALAALRHEIDTLLSQVTAELEVDAGPAHSTITAHLTASRQFLIQLSAGLSRRTITKPEAQRLIDSLTHAVDEAGRTLQYLPPCSDCSRAEEAGKLSDLLSGIRRQIPSLASRIERLFDEANDTEPRVPTPSL